MPPGPCNSTQSGLAPGPASEQHSTTRTGTRACIRATQHNEDWHQGLHQSNMTQRGLALGPQQSREHNTPRTGTRAAAENITQRGLTPGLCSIATEHEDPPRPGLHFSHSCCSVIVHTIVAASPNHRQQQRQQRCKKSSMVRDGRTRARVYACVRASSAHHNGSMDCCGK
jgi:hypothetical protein